VKGDKVLINVRRQKDVHQPIPPRQPPPSATGSDGLPVHVDESPHQKHSSPRRYALIIFGFLGLVAVYLLIAVPITIKISPEPEHLALKGFPPSLAMWGANLVFPGTYRVQASLKGYLPLDQEIEIDSNGASEFEFSLEERPGQLTIQATPALPLHLSIDDRELSLVGNGRVAIPRGNYTLRFEVERYLPYQQQIEIFGYGQEQHLDIVLKPAWGTAKFTSHPSAAEVSIDGEFTGTTPLEAELMQGGHEIIISKNGYKPVTLEQLIEPGYDIEPESVILTPADGQLTIRSTPSGSSVMIDDEFHGTTPASLDLIANISHQIKLDKAGYEQGEYSIVLEPNEARDLEAILVAEYGTVFIIVHPADAILLVNGRKPDASGNRLRLPVKKHLFNVSRQGYVTQEKMITPRQGVTQIIEFTLQPEPSKQANQLEKGKQVTESKAVISTSIGQQLHMVSPDSHLVMGASRREAGRRANESKRLVQLDRPFYFAVNEVTNEEFRRFKLSHDSGSLDGARLNGNSQPVVNISWQDAARFCNWLSTQQGLPEAYIEGETSVTAVHPLNTGFRMPTEAEWAWVARKLGQSSEQRYPWNGKYPPEVSVGNYADNRISDTLADTVPEYDDGYRGSAPVGSFTGWPKGFNDLGGNVAEWTHDFYAVYPGKGQQIVRNPTGPKTGEHYVVKGAGWRHGNITELRLSYRDYSNKPRYDVGFRVARYAE
jgi:formylglycine-generating enzyme required for sulfatase activity